MSGISIVERVLNTLPTSLVRGLAQSLARTEPLRAMPGWRFGRADASPSPVTQLRLAIWRVFARRKAGAPIVMKWHGGTKVYTYLGSDISRCLFVGGCLEPNEFAFLEQCLEQGMTFVDVGANLGLYTLHAAGKVGSGGRVIAVEPSGREFERLEANLRLNGLANVTPLRYALSDADGLATLHVSCEDHEGLNTLGGFVHDGVTLAREERVRARRLDDVLAELGVAKVDAVKIDVEGAEWHVLRGAEGMLSASRPIVMIELLEKSLRLQNSSAAEVLGLLRRHGYRIYSFDDRTGRPVPAGAISAGGENIVAAHPARPWPQLPPWPDLDRTGD